MTGTQRLDFGYGVAPDRKNPMPKHGLYVEAGTKRMTERPTLRHAINSVQGNAEANWRKAIRKEGFY